jgi:hypothetical protein
MGDGSQWLDMTSLALTGDFVVYLVFNQVGGNVPCCLGNTTTLGIISPRGGSFWAVTDDFGGSLIGGTPPDGVQTLAVRRTGDTLTVDGLAQSGTVAGTITLDQIGNATGLGFPSDQNGLYLLASISTSYFALGSANDLAMRAWLVTQGYPDIA